MSVTHFERGSTEYVTALASVLVDTGDPDTMPTPVELSLSRGSSNTWLAAQWVGSPTVTLPAVDPSIPAGKKRLTSTARTTSVVSFDDDYPFAAYTLRVRVTDSPEIPITPAIAATVYVLGTPASAAPFPEAVVDGGTF